MTAAASAKQSNTRRAFGMDCVEVANALRALADDLMTPGGPVAQELVITDTVSVDNFAMTTLAVTYAPSNPHDDPERVRSMAQRMVTWVSGEPPKLLPHPGALILQDGDFTASQAAIDKHAADLAAYHAQWGMKVTSSADLAASVPMNEALGVPTEGWETLGEGVTRYVPPLTHVRGLTLGVGAWTMPAVVDGPCYPAPQPLDDFSTGLANLHRTFPVAIGGAGGCGAGGGQGGQGGNATVLIAYGPDGRVCVPTEGETVH